jgi:hypothetical protein
MLGLGLLTPFHTKRAVTIHLVARMPGWAWKTAALSVSGTRGVVMLCATLKVPVDAIQIDLFLTFKLDS